MRGTLYVIAEILIFLGLAAVIGFFIGRLTSGRGGRQEPLKRLSEVDGGPARSAVEDASQAADLRRRLGIAYQTIRELEESNMRLREATGGSSAEEEQDDEPVVAGAADPDAAPAPAEDAAVTTDDGLEAGAGDGDDVTAEVAEEAAAGHEVEAASADDDAQAAAFGDEADAEAEVSEEPEREASEEAPAADAASEDVDDAESPAAAASGPAARIRAAKEAKAAAGDNGGHAASATSDLETQLHEKEEEIRRLKADLDNQMEKMGSLASRISELES
jgi:hypothetical protein